MKKVLIIGNGISGITAARFIRKLSTASITVISKESDYFFSRTALMYIYMGHMEYHHTKPYEDWFWKKNKINLIRGEVQRIDSENKEIFFSGQKFPNSSFNIAPKSMTYDTLILATGSKSNKFGWPGQELKGVLGLYSLQDLYKLEELSPNINSAVIIGGGLIGIELAEMLHSRRKEVTMLVRETNYWDNVLPKEEAQMVNQQIRKNGINLKLESELKEITDDGTGHVNTVITTDQEIIKCQFVGLTAGVRPNTDWLKSSGLEINKGILVNEYLETNLPNVFAIGDCAELRSPEKNRKAIEPIWYTGRIMGETVAHTICDQPVKYQPGNWFNSAKFFDLEYQVYGYVPNKIESPLKSFLWQNKNKSKSIRLVYHQNKNAILGINLMGIRFRHEICDRWLNQGLDINAVVNQIQDAHFDPEFTKKEYNDVKETFQRSNNTKSASV